MSLFLISSFPIYLFLVLSVPSNKNHPDSLSLTRVVYYLCIGILLYLPVYAFSRLIPDMNTFPWNFAGLFLKNILKSREAYFRILAGALVLIWALWCHRGKRDRPRISHKEVLCFLTGFLGAENIHDALLINTFSSGETLLYRPLSRLAFALLLAFSTQGYAYYRCQIAGLQHFWAYLLSAYVGLSLVSAVAMGLSLHRFISAILLIGLSLFYFAYYQPHRKLQS